MKTIRFTMFLFYNYYRSGRWERVPYFHTLSSMSFLLFLHVAAALCWAGKDDLIFGGNKDGFIVRFLIFFGMSMVLLLKFAPEKQLQAMEYEEEKVTRGGWLLVLYSIMTMTALFLGIFY